MRVGVRWGELKCAHSVHTCTHACTLPTAAIATITTHPPTGPEAHGRVDVLWGRVPALRHEHGLDHVGHEQAVHDEACARTRRVSGGARMRMCACISVRTSARVRIALLVNARRYCERAIACMHAILEYNACSSQDP
jgi:hypothetical protein